MTTPPKPPETSALEIGPNVPRTDIESCLLYFEEHAHPPSMDARSIHDQYRRAVAELAALRKDLADARAREAMACETPNVKNCARLWEADHQREHLTRLGLAEEFPFGCDAIEYVATRLIGAREERDALRRELSALRGEQEAT